jgi:hypothetical protein
MTRSLTSIVGNIDSDGIQKGWIRKVLMTTAIASAVRSSPGSSARKERGREGFSGTACSSTGSVCWEISPAAP